MALILAIVPMKTEGKQTIVAVVDTGVSLDINVESLCDFGHFDFTSTGFNDKIGHGTNVSGLIHRYAGNTNYCQIILKYFDPDSRFDNIDSTVVAFEEAVRLGVHIINYSSYGISPHPAEKKVIKKALDRGIIVVVAAGNDNNNLDEACNAYPACYDKRIVVAGNGAKDKRYNGSNYGKIVDYWEDGKDKKVYGKKYSGTSQATAIVTGKIISGQIQPGS